MDIHTQALFTLFKKRYDYGPSYDVIIDDDFYNSFLGPKKLTIISDLEMFLGGEVTIYFTNCILDGLVEKEGGIGFPAELIKCGCLTRQVKGECIRRVLTSPRFANQKFVIACEDDSWVNGYIAEHYPLIHVMNDKFELSFPAHVDKELRKLLM